MYFAELLSAVVESTFLLTQGHAWRIYVQINRTYSDQISCTLGLLFMRLTCPMWGIYICYIIWYTLTAYLHVILEGASMYPL